MMTPRSGKGSGGGSHSHIPANVGSAAAGGKAEKVGITAALGLAGLSDALASPERSPEAAGGWVAEEAWCRCLRRSRLKPSQDTRQNKQPPVGVTGQPARQELIHE